MDVACVRLFLAAVSGWLADQQQDVITYLIEETGPSGRSCVGGDSA